MHRNDISQSNSKVLSDHLVDSDLALLHLIVSEDDAYSILALLSLQLS